MDTPPGTSLLGGAPRFEVANIEEAVELAQRFKAEGRYDWFRGQVGSFPPHSSLHRAHASGDADRQMMAIRRPQLFLTWLRQTPELRYLLEERHVHDLFAIMQHYGIPTHYIDFTTDPAVAGFFAADTEIPPVDGRACIFCLNTKDLMETWDTIKGLESRQGAEIELVTIDVRNLWRLQAQQGVFVYANYNWDVDYPVDRIVFPYTGYPAYPTHDRIYPQHKSPLEQLLDQYLFLERATFTNEEMLRLVEETRARGGVASYSILKAWPGGYHREAFSGESEVAMLASWSHQSLGDWDVDLEEKFHETAGPTLRLKLRRTSDVHDLRKSVTFGVNQILRSVPDVRARAVDWAFSDLPESLSPEMLNELFRPAWNGMRRLPYSDTEIADAFGVIAMLLLAGFGRMKDQTDNRQSFSQCLGDCIQVEFGYGDRSGSRGWVTRESLSNAMRGDMATLLAPNNRERAGDPRELFKVVYNPSLVFEFEPFKIAFAREVIPSQVLLERSPILFNPARLTTFGNP